MKKKETYTDKAYRLTRGQTPLTYMLASRNTRRRPLLYFDEASGVNRPLRYARNQKSPFEDEQDGNAVLEPIIFEDGLLSVEKSNQALQKFLHYHPQNGTIFEEINTAKDAAAELAEVESSLDAQIIAKGLKGEELVSVCRVLMGAVADTLSIPELKRDVLLYAAQSPKDFIETVNDPLLELTNDVVQFFNKTWLVLKNNGKDVYYNLPKNKTKMLSVPYGEDHYFMVASFFQSDDGIDTYKLLQKRLKKDK